MKTAHLLGLGLAAVAAFGSTAVLAAPAEARNVTKTSSGSGKITWQPNVKTALEVAKRTGKPIFIDFYATWCPPCKILDKAYLLPVMQKAAKNYVMVKVDVDKHGDVARKYSAEMLPTMVFLDSQGKVLGRKTGFRVPPESRKDEKAITQAAAEDVANSMNYMLRKKA